MNVHIPQSFKIKSYKGGCRHVTWHCKSASTLCRMAECNTLRSFAARQKLLGICHQFDRTHIKNNFLQTYFRLQKLWNETSELCLIFFSNWLMPFWNPLLIISHAANLWRDWHFADRIFMPQHAEALPKPCYIDVHIILAICHTARPHFLAFCRAT